ncbi:MAG TPA: HD domain-containing protein [Dehalococcoidia bacterium]|nr:HD domain-containing protein [Dehalococcoidia bacterium]
MTREVKISIAPDVLSLLTRIHQHLADRGITAYLAGGMVRDILLGRDVEDIDIAVAGNALAVTSEIAAGLGGRYFPLDEENEVGRVVLSVADRKWELDFSTIEDGIEQDMARRDFTIDAMAIELAELLRRPESPMLIDPLHGEQDLNDSIIRAISASAFPADPVRLLRAVRLAAELSFTIHGETEALIRKYDHLIGSVAGERVREELLRLLVLPHGGQHLEHLEELGLLGEIFPELAQTKGVTQPKEHYWDVFEHSLRTVKAVDFLLREGDWDYAGPEVMEAAPWSEELAQHFSREVGHGSTRKSLLRLVALLHDIAKPKTRTVEESGRTRFLGHAREGALAVTDIMERLRFSKRETKLVELMVRHHLRPTQMSQEGLPTPRAIYRYFRDTGEVGIDTLFFSLADHLAARGKNLDLAHWREHAEVMSYVLAKHAEEEKLAPPPKLVDGHDLIDIFGLSPGPRFAEILEAVREAQAAGEISTREEALNYIENTLNIRLSEKK